jgi:hypothetical protein
MEEVKTLSPELKAANNERHRLALLQNQLELDNPPKNRPLRVIEHVREREKQHIDELASKKARPVNMNPKQFAYCISGHGGDNPLKKIRVPKGCIIVVKAKSGDVTFRENIRQVFNISNRNIILNPNSNRVELSKILINTSEFSNHNHSLAIYNTDDEINNFGFSLIAMYPSKNPNRIEKSGIIKLSKNTILPEKTLVNFNTTINAFIKEGLKYKLNTLNGKYIYEFFRYSTAYEYYFTKEHVEDILDAILYILNNNLDLKNTELFDYNDVFDRRFGKIFKKKEEGNGIYFLAFILRSSDISENSSMSSVLEFISANFMIVYLSDLFKDVEDGILQPGIFYNLICRATDNTVLGTLKKPVNVKGNEVFLPVTLLRPENKNRIGEAEKQRKFVERNVAEAGKERVKRNFTLRNKISNDDVKEYITRLKSHTHLLFPENKALFTNLPDIKYINERPKLKSRIYTILNEEIGIYNKILSKYFPEGPPVLSLPSLPPLPPTSLPELLPESSGELTLQQKLNRLRGLSNEPAPVLPESSGELTLQQKLNRLRGLSNEPAPVLPGPSGELTLQQKLNRLRGLRNEPAPVLAGPLELSPQAGINLISGMPFPMADLGKNVNDFIKYLFRAVSEEHDVDISNTPHDMLMHIYIIIKYEIDTRNSILEYLFEGFTPVKNNRPTPEFETNAIRALREQNQKSNGFFYKKGANGKWKKYKKTVKKNLKNRPRWRGIWGGSPAANKTRKQHKN